MGTLSTDTHCQMLMAHIRDRNAGIVEAFKLYMQMFSALVGGAVIVRLQYGSRIPSQFALLSDALGALIVSVCAIMIMDNMRGWYQGRKLLSDVAGIDDTGRRIVPAPRLFPAMRPEAVMLAVMVISLVLFSIYNPLRL